MPIIRGRTFVAPAHLSVNTGQERWFYKREEMVFRKYQNVLVEEPHISSQAALVLLIQFYAQRDIVAMGMHAENQHRLGVGQGIAYGEEAFSGLIDKYGLEGNNLQHFLVVD